MNISHVYMLAVLNASPPSPLFLDGGGGGGELRDIPQHIASATAFVLLKTQSYRDVPHPHPPPPQPLPYAHPPPLPLPPPSFPDSMLLAC